MSFFKGKAKLLGVIADGCIANADTCFSKEEVYSIRFLGQMKSGNRDLGLGSVQAGDVPHTPHLTANLCLG